MLQATEESYMKQYPVSASLTELISKKASDAHFASNPGAPESLEGYIFKLYGMLVEWKAKQ